MHQSAAEEALGRLLSATEKTRLENDRFGHLALFETNKEATSFSLAELVKVLFRARTLVGKDLKAYVEKRVMQLEAGDKASFMTDNERASRAKRWIAKCESMPEATQKCVVAAETTEQADACSAGGSATAKTPVSAKAAWVVRGGDPSDQDAKFVALANNGDVIAAGDLDGTLDLAGQVVKAQAADAWVARFAPDGTVRWAKEVGGKGIEYVVGLGVSADDKVSIALTSDIAPKFSRATLAPEASITSTPIPIDGSIDGAAIHANGDTVTGFRGYKNVKGEACAGRAFVVKRFAADGKQLWTRCNDEKDEASFTEARMRFAAGPNGMTAVCGVFSGQVTWSETAAPASEADAERAFVLVLDANGAQRWVGHIDGEAKAFCDAITVADDGSVAAVVRATGRSALTLWDSHGRHSWTHVCRKLVDASDDCELSAVAASGSDIVVAGHLGRYTGIATIDNATGERKKLSVFDEGARIEGLAARAGAVVFATGFSGLTNFGTPVESDGASVDVLVGRL